MSQLNMKSSKPSHRNTEAQKAELSHANFMSALANCPIVAEDDHLRSEYDVASKTEFR